MSNNYKTLRTRIAQKFDLISNWSQENSITLLKGELAFDETNRFKVGDGIHKWSSLPYSGTYALDCSAFPTQNVAPGMLVSLSETVGAYTPGLYILEKIENNTPVWTKIATGEDLSGKITEIQTKLTEIDSAIALLQAEDDAINERVESGFATLATAQETQSAQIDAVQQAIEQISSDIDSAIASSISAIQSDISTIQSDIDVIEESIGTVKTDTNGDVIDLQSQIDAINDKIGDVTVPAYTEISGETIVSKLVTVADAATIAKSKVTAVIDDNNKIIKSALPSYVDDVIEGFVGYKFEDTTADPVTTVTTLYDLTHYDIEGEGNDSVTGFFVLSSNTFDINSRTEATTTKYALISKPDNPAFTTPFAGGTIDGNQFWAFETDKNPIAPENDAIYVDIYTNKTYRWSGTRFTLIAADLSLGTTSETAFRGDLGKELYDIIEGTTETQGLVSEVSELNAKIEQLEEITENVDDYATKEELLAATAPVAESVSSLESEFVATSASLSEKIEEVKALIGNLSGDTIPGDTVVASLAYLKNLIDDLVSTIDTTSNNWNVVEGNTVADKFASLKTALTDLQSSLEDIEGSLGALIAQNASDISSLSDKEAADIQNLAALIATLSDTIASITTESSELEGQVDQNTSDIEEIQGKLEDANNPVPDGETVQGEINGLAAGLTALQNELETSVNDLEAAEEVLAVAVSTKVDYSDTVRLQCGGAFDE